MNTSDSSIPPANLEDAMQVVKDETGKDAVMVQIAGPPKTGMPVKRRPMSFSPLLAMAAAGMPLSGLRVRRGKPQRLQCHYCTRLQRKDDHEAKGWQTEDPVLCPACLKNNVPGSRIKPVCE